jgi:hypothetical protein
VNLLTQWNLQQPWLKFQNEKQVGLRVCYGLKLELVDSNHFAVQGGLFRTRDFLSAGQHTDIATDLLPRGTRFLSQWGYWGLVCPQSSHSKTGMGHCAWCVIQSPYLVCLPNSSVMSTLSYAVHHNLFHTTLVDVHLDAQNYYLFTYNTFIKIIYMFRALTCSSLGGLRRNCIYAASGTVTPCRWLSCATVVTIPDAACIQLRRRPPEDEQGNSRNM